jgi:hypothetical protein
MVTFNSYVKLPDSSKYVFSHECCRSKQPQSHSSDKKKDCACDLVVKSCWGKKTISCRYLRPINGILEVRPGKTVIATYVSQQP